MVNEDKARRREARHSAAQRRDLVAAWKQSGLGRRQWCAEHGVNGESLRRWAKRIEGSAGEARVVEVGRELMTSRSTAALRVRIAPNGEIELSGSLNEEILRSLIRAVRTSGNVH